MSYVQKNLGKDEQIVYCAKKHWYILFGPIVGLLIGWMFSLILESWAGFIAVAIIAAFLMARYFLDEFVVTNKRIVMKTGVLSLSIDEAPLSKINYVNVHKSFWGRILGFGTIYCKLQPNPGKPDMDISPTLKSSDLRYSTKHQLVDNGRTNSLKTRFFT